jgi:hypothetical protein
MIQGSGALTGFTFNFTSSNLDVNITAHGTFSFNGTADQAEKALESTGYVHYNRDDLNVLHPSTNTYNAVDYRSPGARDTGADSGHFTVHEPVSILRFPGDRPVQYVRIPEATVPTSGDVHFGEHNPFTGGLSEHLKEVKRSIWP